MKLTDAEKAAVTSLLGLLLPTVNNGCDAWLGNPDDDNCLLSYDDADVDVLNGLLKRLQP